ncbi:UDP-N-acetylmuramoyl-tripeptide--D-alanyl-D-alanine ligase [Candidatus Saganbacteria bacterium]|nr:UDP-N-acetylmuramoyl-tripeptide--D-alanyl-D-alanine ligase [Candidatus Saganbacteria bacterium]
MLTRDEIEKIACGKILPEDKPFRSNDISIDTRTIEPNDLFIPIKGENFDGRTFIKDALKKGAFAMDVKNGLEALQNLAAYHRAKFKIPVIGVTGSVGKTTTKDMLASILSQKMPTLKNEENFNNEVGVPLTLLKLTKKHKAAVIEMGMQGLGEIDLLAKIAKPTIAIITNIGEAHMKYLKTKKNIARAKSEVFNYLKKKDFAIINQDDEYFEHLMSNVKYQMSNVRTFGILEKSDVTPKDLEGIKLPVPGEHNIYNALAAIAVAKILKIDKKAIKRGLEIFTPSSKRMEVFNCRNKTKIINDTYNANPQSMAAALRVLASIPGRKIAILGDMLELGRKSRNYHKKVIKLAQKLKIDKLFLLGKEWPQKSFGNKKELIKKLKTILKPSDIILIKGSRGMRMEEIVSRIVN